MTQRELLHVLELEVGAEWNEVRQAYRRLVKQWHPDRYQNSELLREKAEDFTTNLNCAFDELERLYQNGAFQMAAAQAYGFYESVEPFEAATTEESIEQPVESSEKSGFEVAGLFFDIHTLLLAFGLALLVFVPTFMMIARIAAPSVPGSTSQVWSAAGQLSGGRLKQAAIGVAYEAVDSVGRLAAAPLSVLPNIGVPCSATFTERHPGVAVYFCQM